MTDSSVEPEASKPKQRMIKGLPKNEYQRKWQEDNWKGTFEKKLRHLIACIKSRAKKAGIEFSIKESDFEPIYFCPLLPRIKFNFSNVRGLRDESMSIDRIDPTKGYVKGNVQLISLKANRIKNNATLAEFEEIAYNWRKIENRRKREENT
jgi:hypothetical protein